jgi:hypothetical protein
MSDGMAKFIGYSLAAIFYAVILSPILLFLNWRNLDRDGWAPHRHRVDVVIQGDWFDGEDRVCTGIQDRTQDGRPIKIGALHCSLAESASGGGNTDSESSISTHNLSVLFWGRILRRDVSPTDEASGNRFSWRCSRRSDWPFGEQFVCRAIN